MSDKPEQKLNYETRYYENFPNVSIELNSPVSGYGGANVYTWYGYTPTFYDKASFSLDNSGRFKLHSEKTLEIVAGGKYQGRDESILINSCGGNLTIIADKNGNIKISGQNVLINAKKDLDIKTGGDMNIEVGNALNINTNHFDVNGLSGNMMPVQLQFLARVFEDSKVGSDKVIGILEGSFRASFTAPILPLGTKEIIEKIIGSIIK